MENRMNDVALALRNGIGSDPSNLNNLKPSENEEISLPLSIFRNGLSGLEAISKHLKDNGLRYCDIAKLIGRDDRTVWNAYNSAQEKDNESTVEESKLFVPLHIFNNRMFSVLENLSVYLKEELRLRYCDIANLLRKDQRTIWTAYNRAKKKRKNVHNN